MVGSLSGVRFIHATLHFMSLSLSGMFPPRFWMMFLQFQIASAIWNLNTILKAPCPQRALTPEVHPIRYVSKYARSFPLVCGVMLGGRVQLPTESLA